MAGSITAEPDIPPPPAFEVAPPPVTPDPPATPEPPEFPPPPVFDMQPAPPVPSAPRPPAVETPAWAGWSKAPLFPRLLASFIDSLIMQPLIVPGYLWLLVDAANERVPVGGMILLSAGGLWMLVYAYIKDGLKGASFGKRIAGLTVVSLKDGRPIGVGASALRALTLGLLGIVEPIMVLVDPGGQRIGDKLAKTQVIRTAEFEAAAPGWVRPGKGLAIGLLTASLIVGVVGSAAGGLVLARAFDTPSPSVIVEPAEPPASAEAPSGDQAEVEAAARVVEGFYEGINDARMDVVRAALAPDLKDQAEPGVFEGWSRTTFELARGWIDGGTAHVVGRESQRAYGSGGEGGVEFTLVRVDGQWLIDGWAAVDAAQVEGSGAPGSATGITGGLDATVARDIIDSLLRSRQSGDSSTIRGLVTERFAKENGGAWLDGVDNSDYFTDFEIVSVDLAGGTASVKVKETWVDGVNTSTYGVVERNGSVLVDTWEVR